MEVVVVSKEMIKPSSSTPPHLKHYKFSLLDQFAPPSYIRFVLFYNNIPDQQHILKFKKSLADSLSLYYPLAGKYIKDQSLIHCNDDGALFVQARVEGGDVEDPDIQLEALLPAGHDLSECKDEVLTAIQATHFRNGISVGICVTHKIVDGAGVAAFIKCWGAQATGKEFDPPTFEASKIWPPMENPPANSQIVSDNRPQLEMVTKTLFFSAVDIANLRGKAKGKETRPPSRVVAVMALLWRCLMLTTKKEITNLPYLLGFPVNLRPRIVPPLGESSFGSINKLAMTIATSDERDLGIDEAAARISMAARKVDDGYARNRELWHGLVLIHEPFRGEIFGKLGGGKMQDCVMTSWCGFGLYDANLGWGRPDQVRCVPAVSNKTCALLTDAKDGAGIEVSLTMGLDEMKTFEKLAQLLSFSSPIR